MRGGRAVAAAVLAGLVAFVVGIGAAWGGSEPDPDTNDTVLGTSGGLRYAAEAHAFDLGNHGYTRSNAGCGPDDWHIVGGGALLSGPSVKNRKIEDTRPYDWYDADSFPEDGWDSSGYGGSAGTLESFSICKAEPQPDYFHKVVPDSSGPVRFAKQKCEPGSGKVIGGGGFIATSESFMSQTYPYDGSDSDSAPDDGWAIRVLDTVGGIGGMSVDAVCQSGDVSYASSVDSTGAHSSAIATANCGAGSHVSGGGGRMSGPGGAVHLASSLPIDDSDPNEVPDDGWRAVAYNGSSSGQKLTAYAVCLG